MEEIKNKMYNFETTPPEGVWNSIVLKLDDNEAKVIPLATRRSKSFTYMAAASVVALLFCLIFFINRFSNSANDEYVTLTSNENTPQDSANITNVIMTVPIEEKPVIKNNIENSESLTQTKLQKDISNQKQKKGEFQNTGKTDNNLIAANTPSRYITIQGPQGQSIKVSSKMATLIDSSETKVSSKPIWDKKIDEWRERMKVNTLAPTPGNFLDIVELTKTLKDK